MSWQAASWAQEQRTGKSARKALLLILANYADEFGHCWPSQATLAAACEMSIDSVQRHLKKLRADGILKMEKVQPPGGRWPFWRYVLQMPGCDATEPQIAARHRMRAKAEAVVHRAATSPSAEPQPARPPGRKLCGMNSKGTTRGISIGGVGSEEQQTTHQPSQPHKAAKGSRRDIQQVQAAVVDKLGKGNAETGWLMFGDLPTSERKRLEGLEAAGQLTRTIVEQIAAHLGGAS